MSSRCWRAQCGFLRKQRQKETLGPAVLPERVRINRVAFGQGDQIEQGVRLNRAAIVGAYLDIHADRAARARSRVVEAMRNTNYSIARWITSRSK